MSLSQYEAYPDVDNLMAEIDTYDLHEHIVELEGYGMTVVPPERMQASDGFVERLREAIIRTCEKRNGVTIGDHRTAKVDLRQAGGNSWHLLEEDEVFVEAAINPVVLALVRWLLGQSAVFSGQTWIIKGEGAPGLGLHSDSHGIPPGAGQIAHMCNASWVCTDYAGQDDGPTLFVPGSHHYGRATLPHESNLENTPYKFVPLIAKAGSLAIWNGATWHASAARKKPGVESDPGAELHAQLHACAARLRNDVAAATREIPGACPRDRQCALPVRERAEAGLFPCRVLHARGDRPLRLRLDAGPCGGVVARTGWAVRTCVGLEQDVDGKGAAVRCGSRVEAANHVPYAVDVLDDIGLGELRVRSVVSSVALA